VRVPLVDTTPLDDPAAARALRDLAWRLYPSRSAVEAWTRQGVGFQDRARVAAVGPGTAAALRAAGADVAFTPTRATGEALAKELLAAPHGPRRGDVVGLVRGDRGRADVKGILQRAGVVVRTATLYATHARAWPDDVRADAVVLASPSAVAALPDAVARAATLVAIGPTTAAALRDRGLAAREAAEPTEAGVVEALRADLAVAGGAS
ncbi:MAG: uroporphyrinogen-III synthase, partial [Trueperaceae bacterium]|nr:uroporphyrinogen-III synthase [Trueperaceae bacterium]